MSATDEYLANNERYAASLGGRPPLAPSRGVAVLACMDARLHIAKILGIREGEAHVIRNAGGVVTDDEIRSLAISQRLLGTTEVIVVNHTECGMLTFTDEDFDRQLAADAGTSPGWRARAFSDLDDNVRAQLAAIRSSPWLPHTDRVRGFVLDVATGRLREVEG